MSFLARSKTSLYVLRSEQTWNKIGHQNWKLLCALRIEISQIKQSSKVLTWYSALCLATLASSLRYSLFCSPSTRFCSTFICSRCTSYSFIFVICSCWRVCSCILDKSNASVAYFDFSKSWNNQTFYIRPAKLIYLICLTFLGFYSSIMKYIENP